MMRRILFCMAALFVSVGADAALVAEDLGLPPLRYSATAWAPEDTAGTSSGRSILAMSGLAPDGDIRTYIVWITPDGMGNPQVDMIDSTSVPGVVFGDLDWADYDQNGQLDLAIAGRSVSVEDTNATLITGVYRQVSRGTFLPIDFPAQLPVDSCVVRWVDYDVDGFVDLFIFGRTRSVSRQDGSSYVTPNSARYVYRNVSDGNTFQLVPDDGIVSKVSQIRPFHDGDVAFGDIDGNGTPDLVISGRKVRLEQGGEFSYEVYTELYINDPPGVFVRQTEGVTAFDKVFGGGVAFGDYDNDGDLDLIISGYATAGGPPTLTMYENLGARTFVARSLQLDLGAIGAVVGRMRWGDVNNDGFLDVVTLGNTTIGGASNGLRILKNNGDRTMSALATGTTPLSDGSFAIGHLDGDGTLDIIATGYNTDASASEAYSWRTIGVPPNSPPTAPSTARTDINVRVQGSEVIVTWRPSADPDYANIPLTHEIFLGRSAVNLISNRAQFGPGAQGHNLSFQLNRSLPANTELELRIRAVDPSWATSDWSASRLVRVQDFVNSKYDGRIVAAYRASAMWVDVNNDGAPDLVVNGTDFGENRSNQLYMNTRGALEVETAYTATAIERGDQGWGDIDGDGYIDQMISGFTGDRITRVYRNRSADVVGRFDSIPFDGPGMTGSSVAAGDLDNDGDVDFVYTGLQQLPDGSQVLKTYAAINQGIQEDGLVHFETIELNLRPEGSDQGVMDGMISLHDVTQNGFLDITIQGTTIDASYVFPDYGGILEVYQNNGNLQFSPLYVWEGARTPAVPNLPIGSTLIDQLDGGEHAWVDIDNDGDPDLIVTGYSNTTTEFHTIPDSSDNATLRIYENVNGELVLKQSEPGVWLASIAVADIDNDGDPDLIISGFDDHIPHASPALAYIGSPAMYYYVNDGSGVFTKKTLLIFDNKGGGSGAVRLADFDGRDGTGDGDLDLFVTGFTGTEIGETLPQSSLLSNTNSAFVVNQPPYPPTGLEAIVDTTNSARLVWDSATDPNGPASFTYTLRVGTPAWPNAIRSGAEPVGPGALGYVQEAWLTGLEDGVYTWAVQAVDPGWKRSAYSMNAEFIIDTTPPVVAGILGDTLGVNIEGSLLLNIDFDDELTGVDTTAAATEQITVTISLPGETEQTVTFERWSPGFVWVGAVNVSVSRFLREPVTINISGVRDVRGNTIPFTSFSADLHFPKTTITALYGGRIYNSARTIELYVPPNAVSADVGISLVEPALSDLPLGPREADPVGVVAQFVPDSPISDFAQPAVLTMDYSAGVLPRPGNDAAEKLAQGTPVYIYRLDGSEWTYLGGRPSDTAPTVSVPITQLGTYALFATTGATTVETLADLTCMPRVFSPGVDIATYPDALSDKTTIAFSVGSPEAGSDAEVTIYNRAGRTIRELERSAVVAGGNTVDWDGRDTDNDYVPSGLYIVVVKVGGIQETKTVVVLNKYPRP